MSCLNAAPETVALAVLDACERAVRGAEVDFDDSRDSDAKFMKSCVKAYASRARMLKLQAAASWKPEFTWMLERCHSIGIDDVDVVEKEGVRTEKMKCVACGRWEHCCKKALNGVGSFEFDRFNSGNASDLQLAWQLFNRQYEKTCRGGLGASSGKLPACDFGEFTIGSTCLRKAELFYMCNTLMMEQCYEALQSCKGSDDFRWSHEPMNWNHATAENAASLVERLRDLELAIADDRRPVPDWGTDAVLWSSINKSRERAGGGDPDRLTELLRERAEASLERARNQLYVARVDQSGYEEEDDGGDYDLVGGSDEEEEEEERPQHSSNKAPVRFRRVLDDDSSGDDEQAPVQSMGVCAAKGGKKRAQSEGEAPAPRRSKRLGESQEASAAGPSNAPASTATVAVEEEAEDDEPAAADEEEALDEDMRSRSRAAPPNAFTMAAQQRAPGQRLPARREALFNLGALQLKLMREGRDTDSAICTNAMFVMQELLARVDQLAHTAGI